MSLIPIPAQPLPCLLVLCIKGRMKGWLISISHYFLLQVVLVAEPELSNQSFETYTYFDRKQAALVRTLFKLKPFAVDGNVDLAIRLVHYSPRRESCYLAACVIFENETDGAWGVAEWRMSLGPSN